VTCMDTFHLARKRMVETQIIRRDITDQAVIRAMGSIPRHLFVEEALRDRAYGDFPLPIGSGQTISQPFMVALMTSSLGLTGVERVLEIGTGSGYQTAVLAEIAERVVSVERLGILVPPARTLLERLGYHRVVIHSADGTLGWKDGAPYDAILVTAGAPEVPRELLGQLEEGGRLVIPVGARQSQVLKRVTRRGSTEITENLGGCVFVPLIGKSGWSDSALT
jgi:protein-L-isoaspartate(D-aspartate) O-methyltransferase